MIVLGHITHKSKLVIADVVLIYWSVVLICLVCSSNLLVLINWSNCYLKFQIKSNLAPAASLAG